jgi:hypothetical protein
MAIPIQLQNNAIIQEEIDFIDPDHLAPLEIQLSHVQHAVHTPFKRRVIAERFVVLLNEQVRTTEPFIYLLLAMPLNVSHLVR